jgi:putative peptidoglycan lipid II flippase
VFLVVPSAVAFIAIGGYLVALIFQGGRFNAHDTEVVWMILTGSAIGLSAGTQGRLLSSAFYALHDTKSPLYAALVRVTITGTTAYLFALPLRHALGYSNEWGAFALTASAGFAAWIEFLLLRSMLARRIGDVPIPGKLGLGALFASAVAGAAGYGAGKLTERVVVNHWAASIVAIATFGTIYLAIMLVARVPEASGLVRRALRRR